MSAINGNAEAELLSLNFSPTELARVEKVPEFVAAINEFAQSGGHFVKAAAGAEMVPDENFWWKTKNSNDPMFFLISKEDEKFSVTRIQYVEKCE